MKCLANNRANRFQLGLGSDTSLRNEVCHTCGDVEKEKLFGLDDSVNSSPTNRRVKRLAVRLEPLWADYEREHATNGDVLAAPLPNAHGMDERQQGESKHRSGQQDQPDRKSEKRRLCDVLAPRHHHYQAQKRDADKERIGHRIFLRCNCRPRRSIVHAEAQASRHCDCGLRPFAAQRRVRWRGHKLISSSKSLRVTSRKSVMATRVARAHSVQWSGLLFPEYIPQCSNKSADSGSDNRSSDDFVPVETRSGGSTLTSSDISC